MEIFLKKEVYSAWFTIIMMMSILTMLEKNTHALRLELLSQCNDPKNLFDIASTFIYKTINFT